VNTPVAYNARPAFSVEKQTMWKNILCLLGLLVASTLSAKGVYQTPDAFLNEAFDGQPPKPAVIWLTGETGKAVAGILQHKPNRLRVRYWARGARSAWILEEIGKEKPITVGIVIDDGRIRRIRVLAFRESRGDEVRHAFFTRQFENAALENGNRLDRSIDGISGATLSVRALTKLARVALYLDGQRRRHES